MEGVNNFMKSGTLLRQVINKINADIDFDAMPSGHLFNGLYETMLKDLQSAGKSGEFYTPRPVTRFIVEQVNPKLGETVLDPACGTGGKKKRFRSLFPQSCVTLKLPTYFWCT